ncbi:hypothetical protein X976_5344 [Burkholderia pseudomallei MSHR7500]|nr:hypothetical protein X976_5344 [Burkholderia pseudomallei MSHR7500]
MGVAPGARRRLSEPPVWPIGSAAWPCGATSEAARCARLAPSAHSAKCALPEPL